MAEIETSKLIFCGHCREEVSRRTYYQHRRLFFNKTTQEWSQARLFHDADEVFSLAASREQLPTSAPRSRSCSPVYPTADTLDCTSFPRASANHGVHSSMTVNHVDPLVDAGIPDHADLEDDHDEEQDGQIEVYDEEDLDNDLVIEDKSTPGPSVKENQNSSPPILRLFVFFLFMFQAVFKLSDSALDVLFKFFYLFFKLLSQKLTLLPNSFLNNLPWNLRSARKDTRSIQGQFHKYVCCPECRTLYEMDNCIIRHHDGRIEGRKCSFVRFPDHTQKQHQRACNISLMKEIRCQSNHALYPRAVYSYKSLIESLQQMLLRPDFLKKCELWRNKTRSAGVYSDVYDGAIWAKFQTYDGRPFLSLPGNLALQINIDWFNPYKHTQHSEGAIYLSVLNLPRNERYVQENIILLGVIPGPKEPALHVNTFLQPFVDELQSLWAGVVLKNASNHSIVVRAALICCSSDIPASRKLCGFVGHSANKGCNKCLLSFPTKVFGEKGDYSNFDQSAWTPRTLQEHRQKAKEYKDCNTLSKQKYIEKEYGIRYSALLELPYFDPISMCVIDPMHNLLLGTCKHIVEIWKSKSILSSNDFDIIQARVNSFVCPPDIGRIPSKLASKFSGVTAEQWKNWIVIFSLYALKEILPWRHYNCWHLFTKICCLLCQRTISEQDICDADELIKQFWKSFVELYGKESCTMNTHLHGHLATCIRDFGPVYSFWCFAYERMNGILGAYRTNNHHVSVQYMRKFLESKTYAPSNWPAEFTEDFAPLLQQFVYHKGSLMQKNMETEVSTGNYHALPPVTEYALSVEEKSEVKQCLGVNTVSIHILCKKVKCLSIGDCVIGSKGSRHSKSSLVLVQSSRSDDCVELAEVQHYLECTARSNLTQYSTIWFARVETFLEHPCKLWYGHPVQVWTTVPSPRTILVPVCHIKSRVAYVKCTKNFGKSLISDSVYVVVPLKL